MPCCGGGGESKAENRVFGTSALYRMTPEDVNGSGVPNCLVEAATYIRAKGLETQGVFRRSANAVKLNSTKEMYNLGEKVDFDAMGGVHLTANLFKAFFRDLREPLLTTQFHPHISKNFRTNDVDVEKEIAELRSMIVELLPPRNMTVLRGLVLFLADVGASSDKNSMSIANCAIVFGPNLVWPKGGGPHSTQIPDIDEVKAVSVFVEFLINNREAIFAGLDKEGYEEITL